MRSLLLVLLLAGCARDNLGAGAPPQDATVADGGAVDADVDGAGAGGDAAPTGHDLAPNCGGLNQPCCAGNCDAQHTCVDFHYRDSTGAEVVYCQACGHVGQAYCRSFADGGAQVGIYCADGLTAHPENGRCGCGGAGEACCSAPTPACIAAGEPCYLGDMGCAY